MSTKTSEEWPGKSWLTRRIKQMRRTTRRKTSLLLLITMAGWAICATSYADSIIGSPGAGFQSWTVSFNNLNASFNNPNTIKGPYWDYPTTYTMSNLFGFPPFLTSPPGDFANVGFCLTG